MVVDVKTMDTKKAQQVTAAEPTLREVPKSTAKKHDFIGNVRAEFKKVSWTSPEELRAYTKIVVGATLFLGLGVYFMDLLIQLVLNSLEAVIRLITG